MRFFRYAQENGVSVTKEKEDCFLIATEWILKQNELICYTYGFR